MVRGGGCLTRVGGKGRLPGVAPTERDRAIPDFERSWWFEPGQDRYATSVRANSATTPTAPHTTTHGTSTAPTTTTTAAARQPADVRVLPANGSGKQGAGARVQKVLIDAHYNALAATNAT